jgi:CRP-like cAMP-binding protein
MTLNPVLQANRSGVPERAVFGRPGVAAASGKAMRPPPVDTQAIATLFGEPKLSGGEFHALEAIAVTRNVLPGEVVFGRLDSARSIVAVMIGSVALGLPASDGAFRPERIAVGPAWLDLGSAWIGQSHGLDARAGSLSTIVELPSDALSALFDLHPGLAPRLLRGLAREVHVLADSTHELMHKGATARLAQWLHKRRQPSEERPGETVVRLLERKRDVASQLAITPETLSRLMRSFIRDGVIAVNGYTVRVLDPAALEQLSRT